MIIPLIVTGSCVRVALRIGQVFIFSRATRFFFPFLFVQHSFSKLIPVAVFRIYVTAPVCGCDINRPIPFQLLFRHVSIPQKNWRETYLFLYKFLFWIWLKVLHYQSYTAISAEWTAFFKKYCVSDFDLDKFSLSVF